ncbi:hypothetical protein Nepgr_005220 [Nepenthes gracilis]|uniref:Uncharacterized protein n=1 Tax=Nepenthes gracilis TaxID=150966 RepID=A0AAD3S387_NEPGR|nr:hypothetical protein Nepgr_005220 [Nepenthes gracilis]
MPCWLRVFCAELLGLTSSNPANCPGSLGCAILSLENLVVLGMGSAAGCLMIGLLSFLRDGLGLIGADSFIEMNEAHVVSDLWICKRCLVAVGLVFIEYYRLNKFFVWMLDHLFVSPWLSGDIVSAIKVAIAADLCGL